MQYLSPSVHHVHDYVTLDTWSNKALAGFKSRLRHFT